MAIGAFSRSDLVDDEEVPSEKELATVPRSG